MATKIIHLTEEEYAKIHSALKTAYAKFEHYMELHKAKPDAESQKKAADNQRLAWIMREALLELE